MTSNLDKARATGVRMFAVKPLNYGTRRLMAGDPFYSTKAHADLLVKLGKARFPDQRDTADLGDMPEALRARVERTQGAKMAELAAPPADLVERAAGQQPDSAAAAFDGDGDGLPGGSSAPEPSEALTELRREYTRVTGRRFFSGWTADDLRQRISEAQAGQ